MDAELKKTLKAVTLELRHLLEGCYDSEGKWMPGDLEHRLAALGVRRDRPSVLVDELGHLPEEDRQARKVVDAYIKLRDEAGVERAEAVAEFVRETAYTWSNRLLALRCMEARELIDAVILQKEAYGGRSLEHHRLAQRYPELCAGDDDGLFAVLENVFRLQAERLPMLFDPQAPGIALRPSPQAIKDCFGLLSLNPDTRRKYRIRLKEDDDADAAGEPPNPFMTPDALGWAYQYWNTEEKERVFAKVRTVKGAKIGGADIVPATQLYTEDYMVKFLVQNSLGATWMGMYPDSKLADNWKYYVKDADRAPVAMKPVREITFLDPACGSGHFHLEAFDVFYAMYEEEGDLTAPEEICNAILTKNLFGVDIDPRAVQIAEAALWMKAAERAFDYKGVPTNLVAAAASHLKGESWEEFLSGFEREPSVARVLRQFAQTMEHIDEIGSLARPAEDLREIIKDEHATWEHQVGKEKENNYLFPEMNEAALSGQLPFHEISDDEFGDRLFYRARAGIHAFTERARASGEFEDQMLGGETSAGFRLVDLLSRRYDIVATNPPYMGSHKMGDGLLQRIKDLYPGFARDLYGAFFRRLGFFLSESGRGAIVTMHGFMFLSSFEEVRRFLLTDVTVELVAHLGPYAFEELGDHAPACLTCLSYPHADAAHRIPFLDATSFRKKEDVLQRWDSPVSQTVGVLQRLPHCRFLYALAPPVVNAFVAHPQLEDDDDPAAVVRRGLDTGAVSRFVRCFWEVSPTDSGWAFYCKGGDTRRWYGNAVYVVRWSRHSGNRLDFVPNAIIPNRQFYFSPGVTFSRSSGTGLNARYLPEDTIMGCEGPGIFKYRCGVWELLGYLGSRPVEAIASVINPSMHYQTGDVALIPLPNALCLERTVGELARACHHATREMYHSTPTDRAFTSPPFSAHKGAKELSRHLVKQLALSSLRHTKEAEIDRISLEILGLSDIDGRTLCQTTGLSTGWYPLLNGYCDDISPGATSHCDDVAIPAPRWAVVKQVTDEQLNNIKSRLREAFERGPGTQGADDLDDTLDLNPEDRDELEGELTLRRPIPSQTFLEELAELVEIHPITVFWLVKEGIAKQGWRCLPEARRLWADQTTVIVLNLLGYRWPEQIETGNALADWVDPNGIIALTPMSTESTMLERLQQRFSTESVDARDFNDVMGKPLDTWLATEFFKHHTSQFKKRPISWQLQSGRSTAKKLPAFVCWLYYHKLNGDTLPKLRTQYVGPLRQRLETEQRGILGIAADARSDRQVKRQADLEDAILELQRFDATLEIFARTGFGPASLLPALRQHAIYDAMLALKARWLRRLNELIEKSALLDWIAAADRTELHPDLNSWIAHSMAHLDYFCARVGPKAPGQKQGGSDPSATDLARLITLHAKDMLKETLEVACDQWWKQFDEVVLGPYKDKIKSLREDQKTFDEQLEADPTPSAAELQQLEYRIKQIKAEVKILTAKVRTRTALASTVRAQIESWQSNEPLGWGDWLAGQPLFDRISSLDGRRMVPTTIAEFIAQESLYIPDINDGVRVNIAPLQKAGVLAADVLAWKDVDKAISDRAQWRADERRWVREGKLPQPGWWPEDESK